MASRGAIAGTWVAVGVDMTALQAGVPKVKAIAADLDKTKATIPVTIDTAGMKADVAEVKAVAAEISKDTRVTTYFRVDSSTRRGALAEIAAFQKERERLTAGYGGGKAGSGGGDREHEIKPFTVEGFGKVVGNALAVVAAEKALAFGGNLIAGINTSQRAGVDATEVRQNQIEGTIQQAEALKSIPVAGALFEFVDAVTGTTATMKQYAEALGRAKESAIAAGQTELAARAGYVAVSGTQQQAIGARTTAQAGAIDVQVEKLNEDEARTGVDMEKTRSRLINSKAMIEATGRAEINRFNRVNQGENAAVSREQDATLGGAAATALEAGEGGTAADVKDRRDTAFLYRRVSQRGLIEASNTRAAAAANTDDERYRATAVGRARLQAFDIESEALDAKRRRDDERAGRQIVAGSQGEIAVSKLRAAGDTNEAAVAATRESYRPRIEEAQRQYGTDSEQSRAMEAERDQKLQELKVTQARDTSVKLIAVAAEGNVAMLRANHDFLAADRAGFEAAAQEKMVALAGQPQAVVDATRKAIGQQRAALGKQQAEVRTDTLAALDTRQQVAAARGDNEDRLAGVVGTIAGFRQELRGVAPEFRAGTVNAQRAELQSLQTQLVAPNRYATELGVGEATGGPTGNAGSEQTKILELIANYLKSLDAKTPAAAAAA